MPEIMTETPSPLGAALARMRLDGGIFFRSEFTEEWAYQTPPARDIANAFHPGSERLIMFHIVARGRCFVALEDGVRHWADEGDVLVMPYGDQHIVGGMNDASAVPISSLIEPPPWDKLPFIKYGHGGDRTDIVCGYLHSADPLFDPRMGALPRVFVARMADESAAQWVRASIDYAVRLSEASLPADQMSPKLPELLVAEVLRVHLASAPAIERGWVGSLHDPVLAPALSLIHNDPAHKWSLAQLAEQASISRSALDERFRHVLGRSPIRYLADWRMHVAADLLISTDFSVVKVAHEVGYDSEEAFSRAFRRHHGKPPSRWRATST